MTFVYDAGTTTPNRGGLVEVGSIRLNDGTFELLGAPGLLWGSPEMADGIYPLSNDHGGFAGVPLYLPREFSLVGNIVVPTVEDMWQAYDLLCGTFNLASSGLKTLTLDTPGWAGTRQIAARLAGEIDFPMPSDLNGYTARRWRFTVPLRAPDPRMYSTTLQTVTVGTATDLTNDGNMPTPLIAKFNGSQTGPVRLEEDATGDGLESSASVTSGHFIEINSRDAAASVATAVDDLGASKFSTVTDWSLSTIPPGTSPFSATKAGGAGSTQALFRSAWA